MKDLQVHQFLNALRGYVGDMIPRHLENPQISGKERKVGDLVVAEECCFEVF